MNTMATSDEVRETLSEFTRDDLIKVFGEAIDALIFKDRYNRNISGHEYPGYRDVMRAKESLKLLQENVVWDNVYDVEFIPAGEGKRGK